MLHKDRFITKPFKLSESMPRNETLWSRLLGKSNKSFRGTAFYQEICNIPTFPLVARRFSQPGFGRSGGVENDIIVYTVEYKLNDSLLNKRTNENT